MAYTEMVLSIKQVGSPPPGPRLVCYLRNFRFRGEDNVYTRSAPSQFTELSDHRVQTQVVQAAEEDAN